MLNRSRNLEGAAAENYVKRGIAVCKRWEDFRNFLADMGHKPTSAHSLDRIDNDLGYEPGNCRWATVAEQNRNQSSNVVIEYNGERLCAADWAKKLNIPATTIYSRARAGWPPHQILFGKR